MSPQETDDIWIICSPPDMLESGPVSGSELITASCEHEVWIGPAMQVLAAENPEAQTICVRCVFKHPKFWDAKREITTLQRQELNNILGTAEVDQIVATMGLEEV